MDLAGEVDHHVEHDLDGSLWVSFAQEGVPAAGAIIEVGTVIEQGHCHVDDLAGELPALVADGFAAGVGSVHSMSLWSPVPIQIESGGQSGSSTRRSLTLSFAGL
jgi:hypothetical protein